MIPNQFAPPPGGVPKINITAEMMKSFPSLECECGGHLFQPGVVFKRISALISPKGVEEIYPIEVLICQACHKVPRTFPSSDLLPEDALAKSNHQKVYDGMTTAPPTTLINTQL
jgi:hypothetical protein